MMGRTQLRLRRRRVQAEDSKQTHGVVVSEYDILSAMSADHTLDSGGQGIFSRLSKEHLRLMDISM